MIMMTDAEVKAALEEGRVVPFFQPLCDAQHGSYSGIEVLARMLTPGREVITPDKFLAAVESPALALAFIRVLMRITAEALTALQHALPAMFTVSFNVCAGLLNHPGLRAVCDDFMHMTNVALCLELTERQAFFHDEEERANIARLRQMGVKVVLDDFGTGHSNLSLLRHAIDGIKIPREFIAEGASDPVVNVIVKTIITLAREMNITVTAEGVETLCQYHRLKARGVDYVQGYLFSAPRSIDNLGQFLQQNTGVSLQHIQ